ncbi:hypothetical protein C8F04DRAFT_1201784 [Mycena alexandri]|uniref:Uncharacterized protein n=1 Tax=Mycena alexandri TaxID=1745969 RepID=A0AAD6RYF1_9AGAR|nr:hypothetical protein C8F04DRAFT_1201784 [Mycena alexandri]
MTSVATSFSGAATNYCGVWMNKCMVFLHLSMHYETYNASTTEPDWGGISNQRRIWTSCAGTEVHTENLSLHNNSNLPGPKWIVNAWCRLHLKFAVPLKLSGIYRPELKITSHWPPKTSVLTQYNSTPKWSETAPGPLGGLKKTFRPSIRFSNADVPLRLNLRYLGDGFNLEFTLVLVAFIFDEVLSDSEVVKLTGSNIVLGLRVCVRASDTMQLNLVQRSFFYRSIQLNFELQPTELGFKYPYNPDDFCLEFNRTPTQLQPALQWLGSQFTGFPRCNSAQPIRPETRLIFVRLEDPQNSQRRVRTAQPNVDSPPQTHKTTRTSQSAPHERILGGGVAG